MMTFDWRWYLRNNELKEDWIFTEEISSRWLLLANVILHGVDIALWVTKYDLCILRVTY